MKTSIGNNSLREPQLIISAESGTEDILLDRWASLAMDWERAREAGRQVLVNRHVKVVFTADGRP